jgi:DNA-binding CsgD family transcriptional regulator
MSEDNIKATDDLYDQLLQNECQNDIKGLLEGITRLSSLSLMVVDLTEQKLIYRSKNLLFADKAFQNEMQRKSYNPYWSLMDPKDYKLMTEIVKAYKELVRELKGDKKRQHSFVMSFHIWIRKQKRIITQKFTPLRLHPDGTLWTGLFQMTISSGNKCRKPAVLGADFIYSYDLSKRRFLPYQILAELTIVEKAILLRAAEGLSSKQIANDLCKSINTIKTHKERLFVKLGVSSMNEALAFVSNYNLFFIE